ncbi:Receptor-type guanylate cyclase gcy [Seminavis robusta]|uniref:Guanylate cyclase n=1 Tax=Seminavis robusta TaxID=568900 RepID=A0A9N8HIN8_9STRA|nr:Receptor-type guanylate cyclase gcy [Seminavis robusta]|eukprot:Sro633_g178850.1 Receptor-type guanylate cyclase gcy (1649) ;mRNA; f:31117-37456
MAQTLDIINTTITPISYVMEPFEILDEDWFVLESNDDAEASDVNLTLSNHALFGNASLRIEFYPYMDTSTSHTLATAEPEEQEEESKTNGTTFTILDDTAPAPTATSRSSMEFGWIQDLKPHNCYGATHMSLWYKVLESQARNVQLTLTLWDDSRQPSNNTATNLQPFSYSVSLELPDEDDDTTRISDETTTDSDDDNTFPQNPWHEIRIPIQDFVRLEEDPSTSSDDDLNNNRTKTHPRWNRLWGWQIGLDVDAHTTVLAVADDTLTADNDNDDTVLGGSGITLLVDHLACLGGGEMLGASFHLGADMTWDEAVDEGFWIEEFYNSPTSQNNSDIILDADGTLQVDFTVQMTEVWGGFNGFTYLAPGHAYYNLSGATDWHLGYRTRQAATPSGRTHLRIVIADGSDCVANCSTDFFEHERWYSFHYILDDNTTNDGWGDIHLPLIGSTDPSTPLWLTGWSGQTGNSAFDREKIKGFTLEINIDSQGNMSSTVAGAFDMFDMSAMVVVYNETTTTSNEISGSCVVEPDLYLRENAMQFQRKEFLGNKCCEICQEDPTCLYALSTGRDCFIAAHLVPDMVGLLNDEILQSDLTSFWMNDPVRRGDFCDLCDCREADRTIDCVGKDLVIVPATFYHESEDGVGWTPRVLDLRNNPKLALLGSGSLESIGESLEELYLPESMRHISTGSVSNLPNLRVMEVEGNGDALTNAIVDDSQAFGDVCCSLGPTSSSSGLAFCNMEIDAPGIDSIYLDYVFYQSATLFKRLNPSSTFMSEAAESPEKCAEYCTISTECRYFSYDRRFPNAEHSCYLLQDSGSGPEIARSQKDHYADEAQTIPGYIAGYPPRTRHEVDDARVVVGQTNLLVNPENGYEAQYDLSLGSSPLRGAVWIVPKVASSTYLDVTFSPPKVVFYESDKIATVTVRVTGVVTDANSVSLVVHNEVDSCDMAFRQANEAVANRHNTLFIDVEMPQSPEVNNVPLVVGICVAVFGGIVVAIVIYFERKRKLSDAVWKVKPHDLVFAEPPEVLGRGTFGLVLKATYRGTDVAVKRVIPPKEKGPKRRSSPMSSMNSIESGIKDGFASGSLQLGATKGLRVGTESMQMGSQQTGSQSRWSLSTLFSATRGGLRGGHGASYAKLRKDFIQEMRHLSKLRHPCITTVMGAVISRKTEPMLIMEFMDHGSLYDLLHNETLIIEGELLLPILRDISQGVRFLHAAVPQVVHGDLKAANILVDQKFRAKVADFGLSQKKNVGATGTPFWMAPELLRRDALNSTASDVYSFGVILAEVYSRKDPYEGEDASEVLRLVADRNVNKRPAVAAHMPAPIQSLMADCVVENPADRPSFEEIDQRLKRVDAKSVEPTQMPTSKKSANISLFDIFPQHIAEALRDGKKVEAEHKDCVTIFFSDIVGFTTISSTLDPRKVANMLDRLYNQLDDLSHKHDLYKVETIGDAYMCCGNLVKDQPEDHVKRVADFAVDAMEAAGTIRINEDDPYSKFLELRVGFHSGPVVADVVGTRNPRYCLFGDTVNVASRMESTSKPGRIHCSKASADLLMKQHPAMPLTSRGEINIKGKGEMHTFWVHKDQDRKSKIWSDVPESALDISDLDVSFGAIDEGNEDAEQPSGELELAEAGQVVPEAFADEQESLIGSGNHVEC